MAVDFVNQPYNVHEGRVENQQPGPSTGYYVEWNPIIQKTLGAGATTQILASWKVPFDLYVEDFGGYVGAGTGTHQLRLGKNTSHSVSGIADLIGGDAGYIDPVGDGNVMVSELFTDSTQRYMIHKNCFVPRGRFLIIYATTPGGTGAINYANLRVIGFPYGHVYDDPADDR